jgi:lysophospholipase L1-like esterase
VKNDPQIIPLDTWRLSPTPTATPIGEFPDLLHPNDGGYRKWAAALNPYSRRCG